MRSAAGLFVSAVLVCHTATSYGRSPTLVDAGTGVVIAAEFRKMCLPRNPTTTTASRSATTITATAAMATRLPRPTLTLLTILSIAGSLPMMNQGAASIMPTQRTGAPLRLNWASAGRRTCLQRNCPNLRASDGCPPGGLNMTTSSPSEISSLGSVPRRRDSVHPGGRFNQDEGLVGHVHSGLRRTDVRTG